MQVIPESILKKDKKHFFALITLSAVLAGSILISSGAAWYWTSTISSNRDSTIEINNKIKDIKQINKKLSKINPKSFWDIDSKNNVAVPINLNMAEGLNTFREVISKNIISKAKKITFGFDEKKKKSAGFDTKGLNFNYLTNYNGVVKTIEDIENNKRLYEIDSLNLIKISAQNPEDPTLLIKIKVWMFSEK